MTAEVAFDLRAAEGNATGVGRHMLSIVRAVAEFGSDVPMRAYVRGTPPELPEAVRVVRIPTRGPLWHLRVWRDMRRNRPRAYCSTSLIIPALSGLPSLPVILDVISFLYPEHHTLRTRLAERLLMKRTLRRHHVIAGSETTRRDMERLFGPCRATVVPPWNPDARPVSSAAGAAAEPVDLRTLGIEKPYALYVGTIEPRKNVLTAIRAVELLRERGGGIRLVLVGGRGWVDKAQLAEVESARARGSVVWTGYVSDRERDAIFDSAACLVLPSIYEGFGLPLLEAMDRGIPCVCSTAPSFDEVAGAAALRCEPFDVEAWAASIDRIVSDTDLSARLVSAGRERARRYSPEATAAAFREALASLS